MMPSKTSWDKFKKGFTIIELLVAISIIGAITAILMPNLMGSRERARDAKRKADMNAMKTALRMYYNDNQEYPAAKPTWTAVIPTYMPQAESMEADGPYYDYYQTLGGDGFQLCVPLEADVNDEAGQSQIRCQATDPATGNLSVCGNDVSSPDNEGKYVICAN